MSLTLFQLLKSIDPMEYNEYEEWESNQPTECPKKIPLQWFSSLKRTKKVFHAHSLSFLLSSKKNNLLSRDHNRDSAVQVLLFLSRPIHNSEKERKIRSQKSFSRLVVEKPLTFNFSLPPPPAFLSSGLFICLAVANTLPPTFSGLTVDRKNVEAR